MDYRFSSNETDDNCDNQECQENSEDFSKNNDEKCSKNCTESPDCDQFLIFDDFSNGGAASCSSSSSSNASSPKKLLNPISEDLLSRKFEGRINHNSFVLNGEHLHASKDCEKKQTSINESTSARVISHDPVTVPYLSPLVLRKEIENVLEQERDLCFTKPQFVDEHPIIYWNMIWVFWRIGVPTHMTGLCLNSKFLSTEQEIPPAWVNADSRNVVVHCCWDNPALHEEMGPLMYTLWNNTSEESSLVHALLTEKQHISKHLMTQILTSIQCNDLFLPIKMLITERQKHAKSQKEGRRHGMYRDLLFFAYVALGRDNIDTTAFDKEYRRAFDSLNGKQLGMLKKNDKPPSLGSVFCRRYFRELELKID
ncbi:C-myc promoter-binding protein [Nymphon striatum]|nr:C-myc promoter-binding protein [Nymphon striatum]